MKLVIELIKPPKCIIKKCKRTATHWLTDKRQPLISVKACDKHTLATINRYKKERNLRDEKI